MLGRRQGKAPDRRRAARRVAVVVPLVMAVALPPSAATARARAGDLDPSFGSGGVVTTSFGAGSFATGQAVTLTRRGRRIVVAGQLEPASGPPRMALARYTRGGRLDRRFGAGGLVQTAFAGAASADAVAADRHGRIVAAGTSGDRIAVARYTRAGRLDPRFGSRGRVTTAFAGLRASGNALVLLRGGAIVVAGGVQASDGSGQGFALVRYRRDGRLDRRFGSGGRVVTPFGTGDDVAAAHALALHGRTLVAAGLLDDPFGGGGAFALARYDRRDGSLDPSFAGDGTTTTVLGQEAAAQGVLVAADGRIVAAGLAAVQAGQGDRFALTRYLTDGTLDPGFGSGGIVTTRLPGGDALGQAIAAQSDGRLVVVGQANRPGGRSSAFGVARYGPDGRLDPSFGRLGIVTTGFGRQMLAAANGVVIQRNGRIVAAGGTGSSFALARYLARP
jgi:uncharacterized delta-60 repeat protein